MSITYAHELSEESSSWHGTTLASANSTTPSVAVYRQRSLRRSESCTLFWKSCCEHVWNGRCRAPHAHTPPSPVS